MMNKTKPLSLLKMTMACLNKIISLTVNGKIWAQDKFTNSTCQRINKVISQRFTRKE